MGDDSEKKKAKGRKKCVKNVDVCLKITKIA